MIIKAADKCEGFSASASVEIGAGVARRGLRDRRESIDSSLGRGDAEPAARPARRPRVVVGEVSIKRKRERDEEALRANAAAAGVHAGGCLTS